MPNKTTIEWTDYTSNGVTARLKGNLKAGWFCDKPDKDGGCLKCYAESLNLRWGNGLKFDKANRDLIEFSVRNSEQADLIRLNVKHPGSKVFVGDMFDLFQPGISKDILDLLFYTYEQCDNLTLQFLTKYTARMAHYFQERYGGVHCNPLPKHFWIGMSAATRKWFDKNISHLLSVNATRFISFEPLLEDLKLDKHDLLGIDWAIIGGESGAGARPCNLSWIEPIIQACQAQGTRVFVKQVGSRPITEHEEDGHWELVTLDSKGGDPEDWPEAIRIREFPTV